MRPFQINLTEFLSRSLPTETLTTGVGERLWRDFGGKIQVDFPSPKTNQQWRLTSQGWVGSIPLTRDLLLQIKPKVPLKNLFRMWEYAYRLQSFQWLDGLSDVGTLDEFYARLAHVLAKRVLERRRKGLHRAYEPRQQRLQAIRGRLDLGQTWQTPITPSIPCRFSEHTADIPDNQILAYTLGQVMRHGRFPTDIQQTIRRAYRMLAGYVSHVVFEARDCNGRFYTRLNQDYAPLHALCRFFLEHTGPTLANGDHKMLPFLINMARLYELFVAEWLKQHLPAPLRVRVQEHVTVGEHNDLRFNIDLVLYDGDDRPMAVLDTKYKVGGTATATDGNRSLSGRAATRDISQIVTYAKLKGCREAILIYPAPLTKPLDVTFDDLRVRSLTFALDGSLEDAGQGFLAQLVSF